MGFYRVGEWLLKSGEMLCELRHESGSRNILYAFVSGGKVCYIGKTVQPLRIRLYGYQRPNPSQRTNVKGNALIMELLRGSIEVEIWALPDNGLLFYGGIHVNLAAGLEDALLREIKPPWNRPSR